MGFHRLCNDWISGTCALSLGLCLLLGPISIADVLTDEEIYRQVDRVKAGTTTIAGQAAALAGLAWGDGETPPQVRAYARKQLVGYGQRGMDAIRVEIRRGATPYSADATAALVQAFDLESSGLPSNYLPGLEEAIWFGTIEARRIALTELMRHNYPPSMIPTIDTAYEFPALRGLCIQAIAFHRNEGARHFLKEVLEDTGEEDRLEAAVALASIGGRALTTLTDATISPRPEVRDAAMRAFLPLAKIDDLSTLYGYLEAARGTETKVVLRVKDRVAQLEQAVRDELFEDLRTDETEPQIQP